MAQRFIARMAGIVQSTGGKYRPDDWGTVTLQPGDRVWGGVPYPTSFFTDWATIAEFSEMGWGAALWDALQVASHGGTLRGAVAEYEVQWGISVPCAKCLANTQFGVGGGFQYIIDHPEQLLRLTGHRIQFADSVNMLSPAMMP